jgi:histidinol-phosphate aminotransferase
MPTNPKKHVANLDRMVNMDLDLGGYVRMDKNENLTGFSEEVLTHFRSLITSDFITTYPNVNPLYRKLSECLGVDKDQIYLSSGSDGGIKSLFEVFVEPDDEVILISPTYAMYYVYAKMFQAKLVEVFFDKDLVVSADELIAKISPTTKLICIANPNSPTGTVFSQEDIEKIVCAASDNDVLVLIDEAYYQYYGQTALDFLNGTKNLIVIRTFSKAMGLASARLGYVVSSKDIICSLSQVRPMYEVNAFAVSLGIYILEHPDLVSNHVDEIARTKRYIEKELAGEGLSVKKSHANFILVDVGGRERAAMLKELMMDEKFVIKGGFSELCLQPYVRLGLGSMDLMGEFVEKFKVVLQGLPVQR